MAETPEEVLAQLERRRRERWLVAALLLVAVLAATALLLVDDAATRFGPAVAVGFVAVSLLFAGSVVAEERRAARVVRTLVAEQRHVAALEARVAALRSVHDGVAGVAGTDRLDETFDRLLSGAFELTRADSGTVWLRVGEHVTVAAARGDQAPSVGTSTGLDEGVAGLAVRRGEPVVSGPGGEWAAADGPPVIAAPLRLPDRVAGAVVLARSGQRAPFDAVDRTAVALFAEQAALVVRATTRLDRERERAEAAEAGREELATLLAGLAHDLRAPLSSVIGYVEVLRERDERIDAARRRTLYDEVLAEAHRTSNLLDGLMSASVVAAGSTPEGSDVDLAEVVRVGARTATGLAHRQGRGREVRVEAPEPLLVHADPRALERVVGNLVDNAVAHSPPGSRLGLSVRREGDEAVLRVQDAGGGMDEAARHRAFERFRGGGQGPGLGLFVVATLVEAHGGSVRLEPSGDGTLAEVRLSCLPGHR